MPNSKHSTGIVLAMFLSITLGIASCDQFHSFAHENGSTSNKESYAKDSPIGTIVMWAGSKDKVPRGWELCDGGILQQKGKYQDLYLAIGHSFGDMLASETYDPATQFFLPDLRGRFIRGVDLGTNRDPDKDSRVDMQSGKPADPRVGSIQGDSLKNHDHKTMKVGHAKDNTFWMQKGNNYGSNVAETLKTELGNETRPINAYLNFIIRAY